MKRILAISTIIALSVGYSYGQSMDWLCHPGQYTQIEYVGNDLFKVRGNSGQWGIVDAKGETKVELRYDSITPFVEHRCLLLDKSGRRLFGIVDDNGNLVKSFQNSEVYVTAYPHFKDGRLAFSDHTDYDGNPIYGYLNEKGSVAIEPRYYYASPFQDGIAAVQYPEHMDYGLINKSGTSAIVSDYEYPFISAPVDGQVVAITGTRKGGNALQLMRIDRNKLKKISTLENGINIYISDDYTSVECQNGNRYYIDNQWRISESSNKKVVLPTITPEPETVITESSQVLSKVATEGGMKITYLGNPIMDFTYPNISTFDKRYAVIKSADGKVGVLKLNPSASITIVPSDVPVTLFHNDMQEVLFDVKLVDVDASKIKWYRNDQGDLTRSQLEPNGDGWVLRMPYFAASEEYGVIRSENIDIAITYDGLDWMHQFVDVKSVHQPAFEISLKGSDTTNESGAATLMLSVKSLNAADNVNGLIHVPTIGDFRFAGKQKDIPIKVNVPTEGATKTFTYNVTVQENGCPSYSQSVSKRVSRPQKAKPAKKILK